MSFRTMIVLASLAIVSSGAARAADLTSTYNDPPAFQWSGAYIGAHGGIASAKAPNPFRSGNGFDGGIQAGYNIQAGPAVFGAEIEGSYLGGTRHD
ncbi:MAG: porin family protein, partial [Mesorhizobium sp.]|nr:porin family protein [Mesorhizobium sp.]